MARRPKQELTALVVDDTRSVRQALRAMLQNQGVRRVLEAEDGSEVFRILDKASRRIDLIFCDLAMPGIDGVETLRGIAARHSSAAIVLLSGLDPKLLRTVSRMAEQLGLQVLGRMGKPFTERDVATILDDFRRASAPSRHTGTINVTPEELKAALDADAIEVHYQPKIELNSGAFIGVEALARMRHPAYGLIDPDTFIPVAESGGLITPLTMVVLEKSIAQAGAWVAAGLDLGVAINLSTLAIRHLDLPERIAQLASAAKLPNDSITLELTESRVGGGVEMLHIVSRFRLHDFRLSVDDFGTGHSGLERLKHLPFTELKIDKAFVQGAARDGDLRSILETSIQLGRRLRMNVVAEGVERWDDWQLLQDLGCDIAQGFLAARPVAAARIPVWAERWSGAPAN
jgi:EAL domain-containing protein (putative c-di-GMP-specific phosphodiesterase class I)